MNRFRKIISTEIFKYLVVIIPVLIMVFIFNYLTPLLADDYTYSFSFADGKRLNSIVDLFQSMYCHYFSMNGRLVLHSLAQIFLCLNKNIFNIINSISFIILGFLPYFLIYGKLKNIKIVPLIFSYLSLFLFTPDFGQSFLWITGASNYLYGPLIALLYLLPLRFTYDEKSINRKKDIILILPMLIFSIIAGDLNENLSVALVFIQIVYIVYRFLKYKSVQLWSCFGLVGSTFSCIFMLVSPGSKKRLGGVGFSIASTLKNFVLNSFSLLSQFGILFIIIAVLIFVLYYKNHNIHSTTKLRIKYFLTDNILFIALFITFLASFYSLSVVPSGFPGRVWSGPLVILISCVICLYKKVKEYVKLPNYTNVAVFISCILVIIGIFGSNYFELNTISLQYKERVATIQQAKDNNEKNVFLDPISSTSRFSCYGSDGDLAKSSERDEQWRNQQIASYFGINKVTSSEDKKALCQ